jgi:predicted O-methyltransferase YrrM
VKFEKVAELVAGVPMTPREDGRILYEFIVGQQATQILELGFAHGTSTCYMAAALDELGRGHITTIDNQSARRRTPSLPDLLKRLALPEDTVTYIFADTSYNWELMRLIEANTVDGLCRPIFDFCFIDGAHLWEVDGLAFFLVDKLLKPGGWILFDDIPWTQASSPSPKIQAKLSKIPADQATCAQVERIFTLLVRQHHDYDDLSIRERWGWAHKRSSTAPAAGVARNAIDAAYATRTIRQDLRALARKMRQGAKARARSYARRND